LKTTKDTKRGKQDAYIAEEQTTQRQNEKGQILIWFSQDYVGSKYYFFSYMVSNWGGKRGQLPCEPLALKSKKKKRLFIWARPHVTGVMFVTIYVNIIIRYL
jgi:hypothetical protein